MEVTDESIQAEPTGVEQAGHFASEFGCVAMSSFESMSATLAKEHWSLHSEPMIQRNYPCDNIIDSVGLLACLPACLLPARLPAPTCLQHLSACTSLPVYLPSCPSACLLVG